MLKFKGKKYQNHQEKKIHHLHVNPNKIIIAFLSRTMQRRSPDNRLKLFNETKGECSV